MGLVVRFGLTMKKVVIILVFLIATVVQGQPVWKMWGYDMQHTHRSPIVGSQTNDLKWSHDYHTAIHPLPVIGSDETLYFGVDWDPDMGYGFLSVSPIDGDQNWTYDIGGSVLSTAAIFWHADSVGMNGRIFASSNDGNVYAIAPDGTTQWIFYSGGSMASTISLAIDGTIYVSNSAIFFALNPVDGTVIWQIDLGQTGNAPPAIGDNGIIYKGSYQLLYAFDSDGNVLWTFPTNGWIGASSIGADGTIYVCSDKIYAINSDGSEKWSTAIEGENYYSPPAIALDGTIYIGSGQLYALDPDDGSIIWIFNEGEGVNAYSTPTIGGDGTIYVGGKGVNLFSIDPNGTENWSFEADERLNSPVIGSDGTLYITSSDDNLYVIGDTLTYSGPIWHVSISGSDDNDGSEEYPFATIQAGIDAGSDGDTVLVHPGNYSGNNYIYGKNIILGSLYLTTGDTSYIVNTLIDGYNSECPLMIHGGVSSECRVTGFTMQNGEGCVFGQGGGIYIEGSSPRLDHLIVKNNHSTSYGGGICIKIGSSPALDEIIIQNNSADQYGGGIYSEDHSNPILNNVVIRNNSAEFGGGIYSIAYSNLDLENIEISNNSAEHGAGICLTDSSSASLDHVLISNNTGLESPGIYTFRSNLDMSFSTVVGNSYTISNSGVINNAYSLITIANSILWNESVENEYWADSLFTTNITYSLVKGGYSGEGNIDTDPLFCNPDNGDFTLAQNSPCVGTGENGVHMGAFGVGCDALVIAENNVVPELYTLHQNYPNPFNPVTTLRYDLPEDALVNIIIYDMMGRQIKTLINEHQTAGYRSLQWNATNNVGSPLSAGIYLYMIQAGDFMQTKKMVLLK